MWGFSLSQYIKQIFQEISIGLQEPRISDKGKSVDSEAVLQAIVVNPMSRTHRISSELTI